MHIRHRAVSGVFWGALASSVAAILQLVQLAVLGRLLDVQDFGLVAMAAVVVGFANVFADVGLSNAIVTQRDLDRQQLSSFYWLGVSSSCMLALLMMLGAPVVAWSFGNDAVEPLIIWSALALVVLPFGLQFQLLLQRELQMKPIALIEMGAGVAGVMVSVVSALDGQGAYSLVFGNLALVTVKSLSFIAIGYRRWPPAFHFSMNDIRPFISFGAFQMGERSLNYAAWNMDKLLIGSLLGGHALGLYSVAYQLMQKPLQFVQPILTRVMTPLFAEIGEDSSLRRGSLLILEAIALCMFPLFVLMAALAEPLLLFFVGPEWSEAAPVLFWLALLGCLYAVGFPIGSLLLAKGLADWAFWLNVWALLLYAGAVKLGSHWGIEGVAFALLVAQIACLFPVGLWMHWRLVALRPGAFFAAIIPAFGMAATAGLTAYGLGHMPLLQAGGMPSPVYSLLAPVLAMGSVYLMLTFGFQRERVARIIQVFRGPAGGRSQ